MKCNILLIIVSVFFKLPYTAAQDTIRVIYLDSTSATEVTEIREVEQPERYYFSGKSEIGLDITGLLAQLTPFNTVKAPGNMVGFKFKKYARRFAYRLSFGFDISEFDEENLNFFYFATGYERRRTLGKKFAYNSGWEALLNVQDADAGSVLIGVVNFHGIDYNINDMIFLGIETQLRLAIDDFAPNFKIIPPTAVFLNVRF